MIACAEILVVEHAAPRLQRLVRREDHRAMPAMALVDDVEEHVGGVGAVGEIARLRRRPGRPDACRSGAPARAAPARNAAERSSMSVGGGREERIEAVLNRAVRDGDRQVRLPAARFARRGSAIALR